jgi:hypothetical protein
MYIMSGDSGMRGDGRWRGEKEEQIRSWENPGGGGGAIPRSAAQRPSGLRTQVGAHANLANRRA